MKYRLGWEMMIKITGLMPKNKNPYKNDNTEKKKSKGSKNK